MEGSPPTSPFRLVALQQRLAEVALQRNSRSPGSQRAVGVALVGLLSNACATFTDYSADESHTPMLGLICLGLSLVASGATTYVMRHRAAASWDLGNKATAPSAVPSFFASMGIAVALGVGFAIATNMNRIEIGDQSGSNIVYGIGGAVAGAVVGWFALARVTR